MHLVYYALGVCIVNRWLLYRRLPSKWYMHLVFHALGVCIVNRWLLYRRHCHQNGTCIQYTMHLEYALLMDGSKMVLHRTTHTLLYRTKKWYTHLVYYAHGVCIVNGWLLYRRHCHQNCTCIQYTIHLEYALLMDDCCIENCHQNGTCIQYIHALGVCIVNRWLLYRRHCHQNGTCIQYTCTWSMHC